MKPWAVIVLVLGAFVFGLIIGFFVGFSSDAIIIYGIENEIIKEVQDESIHNLFFNLFI
jgi:uncharacterized membrane protein